MGTSEANFVRQYEPGSDSIVELKNGRVLDVMNGRYFKAGTRVILQGSKIVSVSNSADGPTGNAPDFIIDLNGKTVIPGLFNTHIHGPESAPMIFPGLRDKKLAKKYEEDQIIKNFNECLARGITNIRHAGFVADMRVNRSRMERLSGSGMPIPRFQQAVVVGPAGSYMQEDLPILMKALGMPIVDPSKEYASAVSFPIDAPENEVREAVDIAIDERGADVIKIGDEHFSLMTQKAIPIMSMEQLGFVVDQARKRGVQSMMHHSTVESFRRGVRAGVSSLEHVPYDALLTNSDIEEFLASKCISEPTLSVFYVAFSWKMAGKNQTNHPELDRITEFRKSSYTFTDIADNYYIPELRSCVMNGYKRSAGGKPKMMGVMDLSGFYGWDTKAEFTFANFVKLFDHGVSMATGNDTLAPCTPGMIELELRMFEHALIKNPDDRQINGADALKIATTNSARAMGIDKEFGTIEIGKTADLVILDGDPLVDLRLIGSRVDALFMDGRLVINNCGLQVMPVAKA